MLNSDWPIGPVGVGTLAAPDKVDSVDTTMERLWWDRPFTLAGVDIGASVATLHLISSYGARQDIRIHTDDDGRVDRFDVDTQTPKISSWQDVDAVLSKTGARYSYQVAKVDQGHCDPVAGTNTGESLPLASIFKLYVLHALAVAVKNGTVSWDDQLTVTDKSRAVGSSGLELPAGAHVSVRKAAEKMIATSDNMATDLLIGRMGTHAIEEALVTAGHHDPASMTPFPTMYELFSVGWGQPDLRDQWKQGSPQVRAQLLAAGEFDSLPSRSDSGPLSGVVLRRGVVRHRRGHLPGPRGAAGRRGRRGGPGQADPVRGVGYRAGSQRLAVHRRESRWPARRPDVQLVRRRQDAAAVGGQLPAELAPRSRADRDRMDAAGRQAGVRADRPVTGRLYPTAPNHAGAQA